MGSRQSHKNQSDDCNYELPLGTKLSPLYINPPLRYLLIAYKLRYSERHFLLEIGQQAY